MSALFSLEAIKKTELLQTERLRGSLSGQHISFRAKPATTRPQQLLHHTLLRPVVVLLLSAGARSWNVVGKALREPQVLINIHLKGSLKGEVVIRAVSRPLLAASPLLACWKYSNSAFLKHFPDFTQTPLVSST